jgi:hypothetical protein
MAVASSSTTSLLPSLRQAVPAAAFSQTLPQIRLPQGRCQGEHDGCAQRDQPGEGRHPEVHAQIL